MVLSIGGYLLVLLDERFLFKHTIITIATAINRMMVNGTITNEAMRGVGTVSSVTTPINNKQFLKHC